MAYRANRGSYGDSSVEDKDARSNANNANNIRNAADVAIASKNPYAVAAGGAVKAADKLTGGKASEGLGKAMTNMNKMNPGGRLAQNASNRLNESGLGDKIGKVASMKNQFAGKGSDGVSSKANEAVKPNDADVVNKNKNLENSSNGEPGSSPSSRVGRKSSRSDTNDNKNDKNNDNNSSSSGTGSASFFAKIPTSVKVAMVAVIPLIAIVMLVLIPVMIISTTVSEFSDAFGISAFIGEDTGNMNVSSSKEEKAFYEKINNVKLRYQANGKTVDALKIVAVFHVLKSNGAVSISNVSESDISAVADAMFSDNSYSEEVFKDNLINNIFPKYMPLSTKSKRESMAQAVFDYIDDYYKFIGKKNGGSCAAAGSCSYEIKGYYISGKGNVTESLQISNLYVRLMQCGTGNGHNYGGTFGQPLEGEELVPFEKYILGVAYQEIGPDAPAEAIKAQMVAARSYILARHKDMGGWRTLKEESDGKWVLQVASCTQDQVYCDPDQGCSATNGQWGQVHSGLGHGSFSRGPMAEDSPLRTYANETAGEVLVNKEGYIIYSGYLQSEQNAFSSLAKSGKDYKQILLQVYNQIRNYGATGIQKNSCGSSSSSCGNAANGDYANWKQYEGSWVGVQLGSSGKTIKQIGCLVTSVSMQIAKSGVQTNISDFNPGTFVEFLNSHGGFVSGGNFVWTAATQAAPSFKYVGQVQIAGMSKSQKLAKIKELVNQNNVYVVAEVKGNTGQHWVAIDYVDGDTIHMMDPGSTSTDMWTQYNWANTSTLGYYKVG